MSKIGFVIGVGLEIEIECVGLKWGFNVIVFLKIVEEVLEWKVLYCCGELFLFDLI